ncbi:hypothetical protein BDV93DRAFT_609823 [Ceratobasidium sp. AG-I]|nr:hypothetical protein BDV93DRAFT_609823 [Ceratobasidium sp. AG-I]
MDANMAKDESPNAQGTESAPAKPRGRACTECRSIKVRCENHHTLLDGPCSRCVRLSLECIYREKKRGRKPRHAHPYAGDGPSEIVLQHDMSSSNALGLPPSHSPNASTSQASSYVNSTNQYGDAKFEQEYSPARGQDNSPFTSSQVDTHSARDSPHSQLHRVEHMRKYPSVGSNMKTEGSGSGTSASVDPDRSLKLLGSQQEPHPKDAVASGYSLAKILSDSRSPSPTGDPADFFREARPSDNYDTPVTAGIIPEEAVQGLFFFYHNSLNPIIALLDPALHSHSYVRSRSSVLFTAIICVACRFVRPHAWERCNALGQTLLGRALADGICSIEYVQALSLMTFWKDPRDSSSWRKVGLAIRMAYELNLQAPREDPLPGDELTAREQLNKERTWLQLVCYDMTTSMQRSKPQMILDFHLPDSYQWLLDHQEFPCNADGMLVGSAAFGSVRLLCHSLFSSMTVSNKAAFEPLMRHVSQILEDRTKRWVSDNDQPNLAPVSKALIKFYSLHLKLIVAELKLLNLVHPQLSTARIHTLECIKCATDVLQHVISELAPNGYVTYCQDIVAITTAYAGVWLFKQLPHVDDELFDDIVARLQSVSNACRVLNQQKGDTPGYFVQFFDHLVRSSASQRGLEASEVGRAGVLNQMSIDQNGSSSNLAPGMAESMDTYVVPELMPPLEGMDTQWTSVMSGLNDWWRNFNYLGGDVKYDLGPANLR